MKYSRLSLRELLVSRGAVGAMAFVITSAQGQVVHDGTLGPAHTHQGNHIVIPESMGALSGRNLFHSFSEFNLSGGQLAEFTGESSIANVISRVTGGHASSINGILKSSISGADFFFINPAGVTFGADGSVDVPASFFVSTADRLEFVNGDEFVVSALKPSLSIFDPKAAGFLNPGKQSVVLLGDLSVSDESNFTIVSKDVDLTQGSVSGDGATINIIADGDVTVGNPLAGGELSVSGGGSIRIDAQGNVTVNEGALISARTSAATAGGTVTINGTEVSLAAGASVVTSTEEQSGSFAGDDVSWSETTATAMPQQQHNSVTITADNARIEGQIEANGSGDQSGGTVKIIADAVDVGETATISADGNSGGGLIAIGGGYQGTVLSAEQSNATQVVVQPNARLSADAHLEGSGGTIVVWSEETTNYSGSITATGGSTAGDGGTVEISGRQQLGFNGTVDVTAPVGNTGSLLLDPDDIVIDAANGDDAELADNLILFGDGGAATYTISPAALAASVDTANTVVQANNSITQNAGAAVDLSAGAANSLTLTTTTGDISFNSTLTGSGGDLNVISGGDINVGGAISNAGNVNLDADGSVSLTGGISTTASGNVDIDAATNVTLADVDVTGDLAVTATAGSIDDGAVVGAGSDINVGGTSTLIAGTTITLDDTTNDFVGTVNAVGTSVTLTDSNGIVLGDVDAGTLSVTATEITDDGVVGTDVDVTGVTTL
ncbi:MAG: filamentous hemagglutinin N-terminal domain-containing protein, partial [Pseudomonadota bacterium]